MKTGVELIAEERADQIRKGWDSFHDDNHSRGALAATAAVVSAHGTLLEKRVAKAPNWGIIRKHRGNRIHQLAISGALIAAEIDRLSRLKGAK